MMEIRLSIIGDVDDVAEVVASIKDRQDTNLDGLIGKLASGIETAIEKEDKPFGVK